MCVDQPESVERDPEETSVDVENEIQGNNSTLISNTAKTNKN